MPLFPWNSTPQKTTITHDKNVVHITADGQKYTIIYGVHILTTDPDLIPKHTDAVVLETGAVPWSKDPEEAMDYLRSHVQYRKLFKRLERDHIKVLFADLNYRNFPLLIPLLDVLLMEMEISLGSRLLKNSYRTLQKRHKSATDLIKLAVGTTGGLWLISSMISEMGRVGSMLTGIGQKQTAELQKLSSKLHPELFVLIKRLRDTVIGYKIRHFARTSKHHSVAVVMGGSHTELENQVISTQERKIRYLQKMKPILQRLIVPESIFKMVQFEFKRSKWMLTDVYSFEELKSLFNT